MKNTYATTLAIAITALFAGHAMASDVIDPILSINPAELRATMNDSGKSRDQVKSELKAYQAANKGDAIDPILSINATELRTTMNETGGKSRN